VRFAWATGVGLLGVLLLGWLTALRGVMHALLIALGATALLPLALVLLVVAGVAAVSLASTLIADDSRLPRSTAGAASGGRWLHAYHAQLARQRQSPLAWGFAAGGALGVVGMWLVLAALVVPLETRTLGILRLAQARLASSASASPASASSASAPAAPEAPVPSDSVLRPSAWSPAGAGADEPVLDAFGRPVVSETRGAAGEFTLRSLGLDGVASRDDLCAGGQTGSSPATVGDGLRFVEDLRADRLGWPALFAAIDSARCPTR
jgi:hypothetical protein